MVFIFTYSFLTLGLSLPTYCSPFCFLKYLVLSPSATPHHPLCLSPFYYLFFLFIPIDMFKFLYLVVFSQRIVFFSQHIVFFSQHIVFFSQHIVFSYLVLSPSATPHHPLCLVMTRIRAAIAQNPPRQFITHL